MLKFDKLRDVAKEICAAHNVTLSNESLKLLARIIEPMKILHGKKVLSEGEVCNYIYYLKHGLMVHTYRKNGMTLTENITHEGDMAVSIESFFRREPSNIEILTLEPSILYGLSYDKLTDIASQSFEICRLLFAIEQSLLIRMQRRADAMRFETSKDRYIRYVNERPDIVRRAPMHNIASLLQMRPETLSRMRAQVNTEET